MPQIARTARAGPGVERRKASTPIARCANAFARCSGGSIARSAKGASQAPSASRRSIPSFEGLKKGTGAPGAGTKIRGAELCALRAASARAGKVSKRAATAKIPPRMGLKNHGNKVVAAALMVAQNCVQMTLQSPKVWQSRQSTPDRAAKSVGRTGKKTAESLEMKRSKKLDKKLCAKELGAKELGGKFGNRFGGTSVA